MKRKRSRLLLLLIPAALIAAAVWYFTTYVVVDGQRFERSADAFDFRGCELTAEEFDSLSAQYPDKTILWNVPLSDGAHDCTETTVTVRSLTQDDVPLFAYFLSLECVDARECTDYAAVLALRDAYPDITLRAYVHFGAKDAPLGTKRLVIDAGISLEEVEEKLPYLTELEEVIFTGDAVSNEMQDALTADFPSLAFSWNVSLLGEVFSCDAKEISFAGRELSADDAETIRANLFRFPALERLDVTGCSLTDEETDVLRAATEAVVVYELTVYGQVVSTDAVELDFSNTPLDVSRLSEIEDILDEFPLLEKVVMCDCGISDVEMDELNNRHEDVRFVWRVYFSEFSLRTDDTNFIAARVRNDFPIHSYDMEVLKYCPDLIALDLGHKQITDLSFLRYVPHLQYLIIVEMDVNDITPIGELKELKYLEMFWTKCEDISPLKNCPNLTDLNISYVWCKPDKCLEVLKEMPQLERLWYCGNNMTSEQLTELQEALPNTEMYLAPHGEPTGSTWREHEHYYEMRDVFGMYYMPGGTNGVDENGNQIIITG